MSGKPTTPPENAPLSTTSPTAAGHTSPADGGRRVHDNEQMRASLVDAINQVFALFRVNYHNQYYAAFSDTQLLNQTKKLWLESLGRFSAQQILQGAKRVIEDSEYLPTLHRMIQACQGDPASHGLPDPHLAYVEACQAPNPKADYRWSHPAVYFAGRDTDWFYLASTPEHQAYPLFKEHYQRRCQQVMAGEVLPPIEQKRLPAESSTPLDKAENRSRLQALRKQLKL